ncbi:MAG: type VI secretion system ImpA family N-terminal domain-containing protein [Aestuariivita sp.]|nr:type VI secretion system ImpA family N-terminal domain-containing protein [Aestuariivita sp.]
MANSDTLILKPVDDKNPCGQDLRWDIDFLTIIQEYDSVFYDDDGGTVSGEAVSAKNADLGNDLIVKINKLCARTKDVRIFAIRAEAMWRVDGLPSFVNGLEDLVAAVELWPDFESGIHPRISDIDDDLAERVAPLTKLLNIIPILANAIGWGRDVGIHEREATATMLYDLFDAWSNRLQSAFGNELPSHSDAWSALKKLLPVAAALVDEGAENGESATTFSTVSLDAWELMERSAELLATQDRHSPALPIVRMLLIWRSRDILEIAETMKQSGLPIEQLLDSVRKQLSDK